MQWIKDFQMIGALVFFLLVVPSSAKEIQDSTQTRVRLIDSPQRIVTLTPALGELVSTFLGDHLERLVGVSEYTDYPPTLKSKTPMGPYQRFNLERVVAAKPDVVFASTDGNSKDQIQHLRELSVPVVVVGTESFSKIEDSMKLIAQALGVPQLGTQMASQFATRVRQVQVQAKKNSPKKVLLQVGGDPLVVAGKDSFLNAGLELVGGQNVFGHLENRYPRPSLEAVIERNPEIIVILALGSDLRSYQEMAKQWMGFPQLKAVKNKQVYIVQSDALLRPTLRFFEGLTQLEKAVYGKK